LSSTTKPPSPKPPQRPRSRKQQSRLLALGFILALAIVFAVVNLNDVRVDWIVTTSQTSLTVVIVVSFLFGGVIGALLHRRASR
jgi:uncharacterized integral membrane protein